MCRSIFSQTSSGVGVKNFRLHTPLLEVSMDGPEVGPDPESTPEGFCVLLSETVSSEISDLQNF